MMRSEGSGIECVRSERGWSPLMWLVCGGCWWFVSAAVVWGQIDYEAAPFHYQTAETDNPIARLQQSLDAGRETLTARGDQGYLEDLLRVLKIPQSSQTLVFSKTSFQFRKISPESPRSIYFNDDVYVGWVPTGEVVEVSTVDPRLGAVFYTLGQQPEPRPQLVRDNGQCLACHATSRTQGVPGHVVRSVYADAGGQPIYQWGTFTTDDRSPFPERWGGWYVTGTHGSMRHLGNLTLSQGENPRDIELDATANLQSLADRVDTRRYLQPTSDIVALMVLEHQTQMHNTLARANYDVGMALHHNGIMNEALGRPATYRSESVERRIEAAADRVLRGLLFDEEFQLTAPVQGSNSFADDFTARGPYDGQHRSLRDFDLQTRLFRYRCSYLIYSDAFQQLLPPVKERVVARLREILTSPAGAADSKADVKPIGHHLADAERLAIYEILNATLPGLFASES